MRIIFAGTPEFAADILSTLIASDHGEIIAAYTQPDRPKGRGKKLIPTPVKAVAQEHGIEVRQPQSLRDPAELDALAALRPDLMIVAAYGLILPANVLEVPTHGCINVHASLLPRWRGAAPIERAIEAGDTETGVTIMQMDAGLDTGDMLLTAHCPIDPTDTGQSLREKLTGLGAQSLLEALDALQAGSLTPVRQDDSLATYAQKLSRHEALVDWEQPAITIERRIRAFWPANTCQTMVDGQRLNLISASRAPGISTAPPGTILSADKRGIVVACADGSAVSLQTLQLAGGKPMDAAAMLNGRASLFQPGTVLGADDAPASTTP